MSFGSCFRFTPGEDSNRLSGGKAAGFIHVRSVCFECKADPAEQFAAARRPRSEHELFQRGTPSIVNIKPAYYIISVNEKKVKLTNALAGLYNEAIKTSGGEGSS